MSVNNEMSYMKFKLYNMFKGSTMARLKNFKSNSNLYESVADIFGAIVVKEIIKVDNSVIVTDSNSNSFYFEIREAKEVEDKNKVMRVGSIYDFYNFDYIAINNVIYELSSVYKYRTFDNSYFEDYLSRSSWKQKELLPDLHSQETVYLFSSDFQKTDRGNYIVKGFGKFKFSSINKTGKYKVVGPKENFLDLIESYNY